MNTTRSFSHAASVLILFIIFLQQSTLSQSTPARENAPMLSADLRQKVAGGRFLRTIAEKYALAQTQCASVSGLSLIAIVYAMEAPSQTFVAQITELGVRAIPESWIPPSTNHPLGFFLAQIPLDKIADVLSLAYVKKMDTAESESMPMNNVAARLTKADMAWAQGWTGSGVKVGVLDSGLDIGFAGGELPCVITKNDYSNYPLLDTIVNNTATGHGTHVTGSILGRGSLSASNIGNGGGAYKGMAPKAELVFLKIGLDGSGGAYDAAIIAALHAAADDYHVNVLNLSYGGWDDYHDGSNPVSQAIDYAYSQGVACFVAAGNSGASARHASVIIPALDTSDYIPLTTRTTYMSFNLIWSDGFGIHKNLSLLYYDNAKNIIQDVSYSGTTESMRGTESQYSASYLPNLGTYYLRVVNPASSLQQCHIYDVSNTAVFAQPDPNYTISYPAEADHAFTVSAYVSRSVWTGMDGGQYSSGREVGNIYSSASRGPRIDGLQKPNIVASGSRLISLRDRDAYKSQSSSWVDNDGTVGNESNYFVMEGTSMATPVCTGAGALLFQYSPGSTPQQIYDAIILNGIRDEFTGILPNSIWGYGKLDINSAIQNIPLPVELTAFTVSVCGGSVSLAWRTATEVNNYGFEIERKDVTIDMLGTSSYGQCLWTKIAFVTGGGMSNIGHAYGFVDMPSRAGTYAYRLKQIDRDGQYAYSAVIEASAGEMHFSLSQNFPNPFNSSTAMQFRISSDERVRLRVFDLLCREVSVLVDRRMQSGTYSIQWNAGDIPSGVYFYRLEAGNFFSVKKMMLQK